MEVSKKFKRGYIFLIVITFGLIALGGSVRAMNAGLACPDWPDYHPQVYFEFLHRVLAGIVALITIFLHILIYKSRSATAHIKRLATLGLVLLVAQIIVGGLTVLKLLEPGTVTLHLTLGTLFFSCLLWIGFSMNQGRQSRGRPELVPEIPAIVSRIYIFVGLVVFGQILLGGQVASHYAGLACTDFPLCNGQWAPTFSGLIGRQVLHRFGAYFTLFVVIAAYIFVRVSEKKMNLDFRIVKYSRLVVTLVLAQAALGIANIKFYLPPIITVAHLATALAIFSVILRLIYLSRISIRDRVIGHSSQQLKSAYTESL